MRRPPATLGLLFVFALLAAACGGAASPAGSTGAAPGGLERPTGTTPAVEGPVGPSVSGPSDQQGPSSPPTATRVPEILSFETPLVGGGTLEGSELAGAPVALWFWAPW